MPDSSWQLAITAVRDGVPDGDPLEPADRAGELIADEFTAMLELMCDRTPGARVRATSALLTAITGIVKALDTASKRNSHRADVIALIEVLATTVDQLAPTAARGLLDEDPAVRLAAARAVRSFTAAPSVARSARRSAEGHPDPSVRSMLEE